MCNSGESFTYLTKHVWLYSVCELIGGSLHINKIHKNKMHSYNGEAFVCFGKSSEIVHITVRL